MLARYSLLVVVAALAAYGITMILSSQPDTLLAKHADNTVAASIPEPQPEPFSPKPANESVVASVPEPQVVPQFLSRLVIEDQKAQANEPLPLDIYVENARKDQLLRFAGLAAGARLSAGEPTSNTEWKLPLNDLKGLYLYAPANFIGVMNTAVDLLSSDQRLIDQREVRLEWLAEPSEPKIPVVPAVQPMTPEEIATLIKRGRDFLSNGDISGARIVFNRLANAGVADGAYAQALTYDPRYLAEHHVVGVRGDLTKAHDLYQRAMQLGSAQARQALAQTSAK